LVSGLGVLPVVGLAVEPHRRPDRLREPVDTDVRQQLVLGEPAFDIPVAVAPPAEFFHDPGREPGRGVVERRGQGLRLGGLDRAVPHLGRPPPLDVFDVPADRRTGVGGRVVGARRRATEVRSTGAPRLASRTFPPSIRPTHAGTRDPCRTATPRLRGDRTIGCGADRDPRFRKLVAVGSKSRPDRAVSPPR
jgi:hypothetical protein